MHASSLENMQFFYEKYVKRWAWEKRHDISVMDIGGANVNGSYADIFSGEEFIYKAVDIYEGEHVDIVLDDPYILPFEDQSIDIIVSGQTFEHSEFFWLIFAEMVRVIKENGIIILVAPSAGLIHQYPVDCYRFYPDAYRALAKYTKCNLVDVKLDNRGPWNDLVGVFCKQDIEDVEKSLSDDYLGVWDTNEFEKDTIPAPLIIHNTDPVTEAIKGDVFYVDILEKMHQDLQPTSYLEIGVRTGKSLALAKCSSIGVDPDYEIDIQLGSNHNLIRKTSDLFFDELAKAEPASARFDFAFIDGMHLFEFALRDFMNVELYSLSNTVVVVDDVFPNHPKQAQRKRETKVWTGDIWKLGYCLSEARPDLKLTYLDTSPTGLLVITGLNRRNTTLVDMYNPLVRKYKHMPLEGEIQNSILIRSTAISAFDDDFWQGLNSFFNGVKELPANKEEVKAKPSMGQLIRRWKKSLTR